MLKVKAIPHVMQSQDIPLQVGMQTLEIWSSNKAHMEHPQEGGGDTHIALGAATQHCAACIGNMRSCGECGRKPHLKDEICPATKS